MRPSNKHERRLIDTKKKFKMKDKKIKKIKVINEDDWKNYTTDDSE